MSIIRDWCTTACKQTEYTSTMTSIYTVLVALKEQCTFILAVVLYYRKAIDFSRVIFNIATDAYM